MDIMRHRSIVGWAKRSVPTAAFPVGTARKRAFAHPCMGNQLSSQFSRASVFTLIFRMLRVAWSVSLFDLKAVSPSRPAAAMTPRAAAVKDGRRANPSLDQRLQAILDSGEHGVTLNVVGRSEEHTSELQSPCNLVCRLLLEKKKK